MARKNGPPHKLVEVSFLDPADYHSRFDSDFEPVRCNVVGWLVSENRSVLKVGWIQDEIEGMISGIAIPKGAVVSIKSICNK
jgi:hypothetical protein